MAEQTQITHRYWEPYQAMRDRVAEVVAGMSRVLEIGPGWRPFPQATEFVDWQKWPQLEGKPVHVLDINQDRLPFDDKSIDFVYCRHTLEDLYNPVWVCKEISRVGKVGYIETPSPVAECARGVDGGEAPYRGYAHHRNLIWFEQDVLYLLPKVPLIEYMAFKPDPRIPPLLNEGPLHWNTYFFWTGELKFRMLEHDRDFKYHENYGDFVVRAIRASIRNNKAIAEHL